jgi:UPF0042 nucleotide-binding protein
VEKLIFGSFGFKYGLPPDANYIFDVRFIPNPFYVPELKHLSGRDEAIRKYISSFQETKAFLASAIEFLDFVIPKYLNAREREQEREQERERKREKEKPLYVAVGCTGGRHRSVTFAGWLFEHYANAEKLAKNWPETAVSLCHRDVDRALEP